MRIWPQLKYRLWSGRYGRVIHRYLKPLLRSSILHVLGWGRCILLLRKNGESEQRDDHQTSKSDSHPRDPLVFFCEATLFGIARIPLAVAVRIHLIRIRCVRTVITYICDTIVIKILTRIAKSVLIYVSLIGIRYRDTIVTQILYTAAIHICRNICRIVFGGYRSNTANVACTSEITGFACGYSHAAIRIKVDLVRMVRLGKKTQ